MIESQKFSSCIKSVADLSEKKSPLSVILKRSHVWTIRQILTTIKLEGLL
jgi:hypothetical protein